MDNKAYLSLGTNMGDRLQNLKGALVSLQKDDQIQITKSSSIYETDPVGYTDQAAFLNMAIEIYTAYSAEELLDRCLAIEENLGRVRELRWGPRIIDLDILLYNQDNIESEKLIVPHPRMYERAFVLIPLLEIDSTICDPNTNTLINDLYNRLPSENGVRLWGQLATGDMGK